MADIPVKFRLRRGTAAEWAAVNPVLSPAEPGFETDTKVLRIGDGVTAFTSLKRFASIEDIDTSVLLTKTGNLAGMSDVATARANLGVVGASDLIGAISMFAMATPPAGWLKANGAAVSRTAYAALFSKIGTIGGVGDGLTTFNLPDLRGLFLRGWDDGRGIDTGRGLGTYQDQMFQDHTHNGVTDAQGGHNHTGATVTTSGLTGTIYGISESFGSHGGSADGVFQKGAGLTLNGTPSGSSDAGNVSRVHFDGNNHVHGIHWDGNHSHNVSGYGVNAGWWTAGSETRPRNLALLACIKF
jgi:microcystin-dependent protein